MENSMSDEAMARDAAMGLPLYKVKEIYADADFNCRGAISPIDVIELSRGIAQNGLLHPIVIRPRTESTPDRYKYVVVLGHNRLKAYEVNNCPVIPCILRSDLSELDARTLNAEENLKRTDLNLLQEAKTIEYYKNLRFTREQIAKVIGKSTGWVQERLMVLDLPELLQAECAAGIFNNKNVRDLYELKKNPELQLAAAKKIKEGKARGEKTVKVIERKQTMNTKKHRVRTEIFDKMEEIIKITGKATFASRCLAWAAGEIDNLDMYYSMKAEADRLGVHFEIPQMSNSIR